jgi:hypothetical protein
MLVVAGASMLAHLGLCALLRRDLTNNRAAEEDPLATPNRPLGTPGSIRLLRVRYYLPWRSLPPSASGLDPSARAILLASRLTGFLFVASLIGFFVVSLAEAAV